MDIEIGKKYGSPVANLKKYQPNSNRNKTRDTENTEKIATSLRPLLISLTQVKHEWRRKSIQSNLAP